MRMSITPDSFQLELLSCADSPFAYCSGKPVSVLKFKNDVIKTLEKMTQIDAGETLITTSGRYAFSVAILASWLAGRTVILPPDQHELSLKKIREKHTISYEFDSAWGQQIQKSHDLNDNGRNNSWSLELPADLAAVILYTSGSTGLPRAVTKSLDNLLHEVDCIHSAFSWSGAAIVGTVPAHHLYGLTFTILLPWVVGAPVVDDVPMFPQDVRRVINQTLADTLISVPVHYNALLQADFKPRGLFCISATAPLHKETASNWNQLNCGQILEIYGSTETGVIGFRYQLDDICWQTFEPIVLSVNSGLLKVKSPFISQQWNGEYETADKAILTDHNQFHFLGRSDSIVKIGGKRTSLLEVERALMKCSGIMDAVTIAVTVNDSVRDNAIWAAVVTDDSIKISVAEIRSQLMGMLDTISVPKHIVFVDHLPRNAGGKISNQAMEELFKLSSSTDV